MAKKHNHSNLTVKKLQGLPFDSATELKLAQEKLRKPIWERLEQGRILRELCEREEFSYIKEEFKRGIICKYGENSENLFRVFSKGKGIEISLNKDIDKDSPIDREMLGSLVKAVTDSFTKRYYETKGISQGDSDKANLTDALKEILNHRQDN